MLLDTFLITDLEWRRGRWDSNPQPPAWESISGDRSERSGYILSVNPNLTTQKWKQKSSPDWASERPHLWKGLVQAGNCRGELAAFSASDGAPQWKLNLKGCIRSIGNSEDMLFVGVQEGTVYALGQ